MQEKNLEHQIETVIAFSNTFTFETIPALVAVAKEMRSKNKLQGQLSKVVFDNYPFDYFKAKEHGKNSIEIAIELLTPGNIHPTLEKLFKQLELCKYECEGGFLVKNTAFTQLKTLCSMIKVEGTLNEACEKTVNNSGEVKSNEMNILADYLKQNFPCHIQQSVDSCMTPVELALKLLNEYKEQCKPGVHEQTEVKIIQRLFRIVHRCYDEHSNLLSIGGFEEWLELRGLTFHEDRFHLCEPDSRNDLKYMNEPEQSTESFQRMVAFYRGRYKPDENLNVNFGQPYEIFVRVHKNGSVSVCRSEDFQSGVNVYDSLLLFMKHWSVD